MTDTDTFMAGGPLRSSGEQDPAVASVVPTFYDIAIDNRRAVTQEDVDKWLAVQAAYNSLRLWIDARHAELRKEIDLIRSRHGKPHE